MSRLQETHDPDRSLAPPAMTRPRIPDSKTIATTRPVLKLASREPSPFFARSSPPTNVPVASLKILHLASTTLHRIARLTRKLYLPSSPVWCGPPDQGKRSKSKRQVTP